jgi:1-deoxy-D-xylulose-5-phosphate reductoisomerase
LQEGGGAPTILNAANEIAVAAFLQRRIGFLDIASVVEAVLSRMGPRPADTLAQVVELDAQARRCAGEMEADAA